MDNFERWMESEGELIGEEATRVMTHTKSMRGDVTIWGAQTTLTCPGRQRTTEAQHQGVSYQEEGKPETFQDSDPVNIKIGMLGIGDTACDRQVNSNPVTELFIPVRRIHDFTSSIPSR